MDRTLGRSQIPVSPLGLGCWAMGGNFTLDGLSDGWGEMDERESVAGIHAALERGVNFLIRQTFMVPGIANGCLAAH